MSGDSNMSIIIIVIVVLVAIFLLFSQNYGDKSQINKILAFDKKSFANRHNNINHNNNHTNSHVNNHKCKKCEIYKKKLSEQNSDSYNNSKSDSSYRNQIGYEMSDYVDPIKQRDMEDMYDHLSYPKLRLPREVLEKYDEYYKKTGKYPPFNEQTRPIFDTPILNGMLIKQVDENEPFGDNIPSSIPLFKIKSVKNTNRFFYYVLDQRYTSKLELKIPLDNVKVNGIRYANTDFYGIPEIYDNDIIENISVFPGTRFKVVLYKTHHFP